jgi:hypothetical protein
MIGPIVHFIWLCETHCTGSSQGEEFRDGREIINTLLLADAKRKGRVQLGKRHRGRRSESKTKATEGGGFGEKGWEEDGLKL